MARFLGLDWDHQQLRVVEANVSGGRVVVRRALAWQEAISPNLADAEEAGRRLKQRLKEAGVAPAPVLACVGRDRLVFRDIRYPDVPAHEVQALVRFQAVKDLAFPQDEAVVDYTLLDVPAPGGEKRAVGFILRKELLTAWKQMCRTAGLKLEALVPRPLALLANWLTAQSSRDRPENVVTALVVVTSGGAEFSVVRRKELLFSRTMTGASPTDPGWSLESLLPELRRTLAAYASQYPQQPIRGLHVAGDVSEGEMGALATALQLSVERYDPLAGTSTPGLSAAQRVACAGAAGIVQAKAGRRLPVDFARVKETGTSTSRKRLLIIACVAAALLLVLAGVAWYLDFDSNLDMELQRRAAEKKKLQDETKSLEETDKQLEVIDRWAGSEIRLADELYDLNARFPDVPGVRITGVAWTSIMPPAPPDPNRQTATGPPGRPPVAAPTPQPAPAATKVIGHLTLEAEADSTQALAALKRALEDIRQWQLEVWDDKSNERRVRATFKVLRHEPREYENLIIVSSRREEGGRR